jgi:hypothetical protein
MKVIPPEEYDELLEVANRSTYLTFEWVGNIYNKFLGEIRVYNRELKYWDMVVRATQPTHPSEVF